VKFNVKIASIYDIAFNEENLNTFETTGDNQNNSLREESSGSDFDERFEAANMKLNK
jgi:hypothetical protein